MRALLLCLFVTLPACADTLRVATRHVPPFAIKAGDGSWSGLSIELWRKVAQDLGVPFKLRAMSLADMLRGLETGEVDVAVAALTVTPQREEVFDFTHPFHASGLGIAVGPHPAGSSFGSLRALLNQEVGRLAAILGGLVILTALLMWFLERRRNKQQFGDGVGGAVWWSLVTLTTVGYGDKAPVTPGGRALASVWMLVSVVLLSVFTGTVASALTVSQLDAGIDGPEDLIGVRVGTVSSSTSEQWLRSQGIAPSGYQEVGDALRALAAGELDAVVYDAPILRYLSTTANSGFQVLPGFHERQTYAFGMPEGHPLREPINRALLRHTSSDHWKVLLQGYLGL